MLAATSAHPDIVISGVMMPVVAGLEPCSVLKADPSMADMPVILMVAAYSRASAVSQADAIAGKPFDLDILDALVQHLLLARQRRAG
jgi:CheY-like chemotaxis protein